VLFLQESEGHQKVLPTKLAGIKDWIPLKTVKGVRSFLGIGNFYWRFIGNYTEITKPLNELMKKMKVFEWSQECQMAFENLKKKFLEDLFSSYQIHWNNSLLNMMHPNGLQELSYNNSIIMEIWNHAVTSPTASWQQKETTTYMTEKC